MRIGIAQLSQETNMFNPLATTRRDFEDFGVLRGAAIVEQLAETNEPGGFIQALRTWPEQPEIVGLVRLQAWPSGLAKAETFAWLSDELTASVRTAGTLDGLLLSLHGAMVAEGHPDVEGDVLAALRERLGLEVPIVVTLDLHAHVTPKMVRHADAQVAFHTAPHIDVFETGLRGAGVMRRLLVDRVRPETALVKIPVVVPAERANTQDPASVSFGFRERLQALESRRDVLSAGLLTVQPWLDVPELGVAVLVTTTGDAGLAAHECEQLARDFFDRRIDYLPELVSVEEAIRQARLVETGLVVLGDVADATTSGAPGDSTWVLREMMKHPWPRGAAVTFVAPEVVEQAAAAGQGSTLATLIGGRRDARFSTPVEITARVERTFDAKFVLSGHLGRNLAINMGAAALLKTGDVWVLVTSRSGPHFAPELFQTAGIDPFSLHVQVVKSPCGFRAAYAPRAARIILVRAPGCAPLDFWNFEYRRIPRPLWPWDEIAQWQPRAVIRSELR
jgi:microcystin degradation protein MlrC